MNEDIVPGLLAAIENDFQKSFQSDDTLKMLYAKVESGKATQVDGEKFAHELGKLTAAVFHRNVRPEDLPNQRMYYNIANRIIPPTLRQNHGIVNEVMRQVIERQNREAGIGIRYQEPEFDEHKAHELAWIASQDVDYSKIRNTVETGLDTNTRMVADDCVRKNAEFQYEAGLSPKIERDTDGDCCSWCTDMAGSYEYARAPKEVFARHANCGCTVEFVPGNGKRQNVHTKDWTSETESAMMKAEGFTDDERSLERLSARERLGSRSDDSRGMANGTRSPRSRIITEEEQLAITEEAESILIPREVLRFNEGTRTGYVEGERIIQIRGDIFPDLDSSKARDRMSIKAVLAHEWYGHGAHDPSEYPINDWRDEARASRDAALNAPNLSQQERADLMVDAYDRAKDAGVFVEYSEEDKKIIYGDYYSGGT